MEGIKPGQGNQLVRILGNGDEWGRERGRERGMEALGREEGREKWMRLGKREKGRRGEGEEGARG